MKTTGFIIFQLAALFLAVAAHAQTGEVARYLLNGNANTTVGTNNGTVVGAVPTTDRFGTPNAAYTFNGTSSRIEFPGPPVNQATSSTITAWVKPGSLSQVGIAVYLGTDNGIGSDGYGFGLNGSATLQGFDPYTGGGFFSSGQIFASTSQWHHVSMVRSGGDTFTFYMNGVRTPNGGTMFAAPPTDLTIGSQNGVRFFNGAIDDVRIFNRALSSNEVVQVYNGAEFCSPHAATATATVINGFVVAATIADAGCGYTNAPLVLIQGGGGSNATATATVTNGQVTGITIVNPGCCYTNPPTIVIAAPPFVPTVAIAFSKVKVIQRVQLGHNYVLESSNDLIIWTPTGPSFTAVSETMESEFDLSSTGRYFRLLEVP
jgi:hypothetical protein